MAKMQRPPGRDVSMALPLQRLPHPVLQPDRQPQHVCNIPGQQRAAWPTLMSKQQSYAFRPGQPGSIIDCSNPAALRWDEPRAVERELALGYAAGTTAAEGVTEQQRNEVLGQCIDANALQCIMAVCAAWWFTFEGHQAAADSSKEEEDSSQLSQAATHGSEQLQGYGTIRLLHQAAAAQDAITSGAAGSSDI